MVAKIRRKGSRNWGRGFFAFFWILLAVFSGIYLFSLFTDPTALGNQGVQLSATLPGSTAPEPSGSAPSSAPPPAPDQASIEADAARDRELAEIKTALRELSQQMAEVNTRLKPIEKIIGPVAALPAATSVTTSPPSPETPSSETSMPTEPPAPSTPVSPAAAPDTPPKPTVKPVDTVKPAEAPTPPPASSAEVKPTAPVPAEAPVAPPAEAPRPAALPATETPPAAPPAEEAEAPAAEPQPVAVAPLEEEVEPASSDPSAPPPAAETTSPPAAETESAALSPTELPPAANDGTTRYGIEIGTVAKQDGLRPLWREFLTNHAALVAGLQPRRVLAPDKKWRLIAGPFANAREAEAACALFKKASRPCAATVYAGDGL
jgi:hypothetical protein